MCETDVSMCEAIISRSVEYEYRPTPFDEDTNFPGISYNNQIRQSRNSASAEYEPVYIDPLNDWD
jgi:hypothetical protein